MPDSKLQTVYYFEFPPSFTLWELLVWFLIVQVRTEHLSSTLETLVASISFCLIVHDPASLGLCQVTHLSSLMRVYHAPSCQAAVRRITAALWNCLSERDVLLYVLFLSWLEKKRILLLQKLQLKFQNEAIHVSWDWDELDCRLGWIVLRWGIAYPFSTPHSKGLSACTDFQGGLRSSLAGDFEYGFREEQRWPISHGGSLEG